MPMNTKELRQKSGEELRTALHEKKARLGDLSFLLHDKKIKNVKEARGVRRDIARILTVIKEKEKSI